MSSTGSVGRASIRRAVWSRRWLRSSRAARSNAATSARGRGLCRPGSWPAAGLGTASRSRTWRPAAPASGRPGRRPLPRLAGRASRRAGRTPPRQPPGPEAGPAGTAAGRRQSVPRRHEPRRRRLDRDPFGEPPEVVRPGVRFQGKDGRQSLRGRSAQVKLGWEVEPTRVLGPQPVPQVADELGDWESFCSNSPRMPTRSAGSWAGAPGRVEAPPATLVPPLTPAGGAASPTSGRGPRQNA